MLIHKLPQTPYMAFPLDWQVWAQENTVYSAFSKFISCWAMDLVGKPNTTSPIWNHFMSPIRVCTSVFKFTWSQTPRLVRFVLVRLSPNWPNTNKTAVNGRCQQEMWQHTPRFLFHRERVQTRSFTRLLAWWRNSEPCLNRTPCLTQSLSTGHLNFVSVRHK